MEAMLEEVLDCQVKGPESLCEELISDIKISQSFYCRLDNLCAIEIKFGTYNRRNFGSLIFSLRFKGQDFDTIRLTERIENLQDNSYHSFNFSPIRKSAGRELIFSIESSNCSQGNSVVLWKTIGLFQGTRYINNRPARGTICFKTKCLATKVLENNSRILEHSSDISFVIPILKNMHLEQQFICNQDQVDALAIDLDNYGSLKGSALIDLSELNGPCLFRSKVLAEQISNGFPLILPLVPTKTLNKVFILSLSSDDGEIGNAIGVNILKNKSTSSDVLKLDNKLIAGTLSFSIRSSKPVEIFPIDSSAFNAQIVFNQPRISQSLDSTVTKRVDGLVDIITLNYNRADLLLRCYKGIVSNTVYPNWRWHVCDNGSTDNSADLISRFEDPRVTVTRRSDNSLGFGEANNLIYKAHAQGEYILFLNNDVIPKKNWLTEMISILKTDPTVGVVGARLYYPNGTLQHMGIMFRPDGVPVNLSHYFLNPKLKHFLDVDRCFKAVTGACLLMRRSDFEEIGGFPQNYDYGYEDVDLCLNVYYNLRKKVIACSGAVAIHDEAATSKKVKRGGRPSDIGYLKKRWNCEPDQIPYLTDFRHNIYVGPSSSNPHFSIITCVTQPGMWMENIIRPNRLQSPKLEFKPIFNLVENLPITMAYNRAIDTAQGKYLIFCHQDLRFHAGWFEALNQFIESIPSNWGVIGAAGWSEAGKIQGGLHVPEGIWSKNEGEAQTVDECFLVVRKGLKFDERITEPHLYGVDICLQAIDKGLKNYALQIPVEHCESGAHPDTWITSYYKALNYIKTKWFSRFPVIRSTTCVLRQGYPDIVGVKPPRS